jgi:repressor LexA
MNGLNEKELEILRLVKDCIERDGYAPAVRDICHALGIRSTSTVHGYLHRLNEKGYLQLASRKSRALRLESNGEEGGEQTRRVPIWVESPQALPSLPLKIMTDTWIFPP